MKRKNIYRIIVVFFAFLIGLKGIVFADVGDFETYSSGSWNRRNSSWSNNQRQGSWMDLLFDNDKDEEWNINPEILGKVIAVVAVGALIGFVIFRILTKKDRDRYNLAYSNYIQNAEPQIEKKTRINTEEDIISRIKSVDEQFNADEFTSWVRNLFIKLQYAWSDRDWSTIRCFETNELYEQHSTQLQRYVQNKQINKMERVSVNWVKFKSFEQSGGKDILTVSVNSKMIDYIIDEETNQIIKGNKNSFNINNYKLTFVRKTGIKTTKEKRTSTMNCPNCGAPTEIISSGKCPYCGSIITTIEHDWVLSNLERFN